MDFDFACLSHTTTALCYKPVGTIIAVSLNTVWACDSAKFNTIFFFANKHILCCKSGRYVLYKFTTFCFDFNVLSISFYG